MEPEWIPLSRLLELAEANGISFRKFERWRKEDLLPRPKRIHLAGKGKGVRSEYPAGTDQQLLAVQRIHVQERRFDLVRFALWMEGYPINIVRLKASIDAMAIRSWKKLRPRGEDALDKAEDLARRSGPAVGRSKLGRLIKRRLKREADFESLMVTLFRLGLGDRNLAYSFNDPHPESDERSLPELVVSGFNLEPACRQKIGEAGPWLSDPSGSLADLSDGRLLSISMAAKLLDAASENDLSQARLDVLVLVNDLPMIAKAVKDAGLPDVFSGRTFEAINFTTPIQAACVLMMLRFRNAGFGPQMDQVLELLRQFADTLRQDTPP